jgi:hypothetical protein
LNLFSPKHPNFKIRLFDRFLERCVPGALRAAAVPAAHIERQFESVFVDGLGGGAQEQAAAAGRRVLPATGRVLAAQRADRAVFARGRPHVPVAPGQEGRRRVRRNRRLHQRHRRGAAAAATALHHRPLRPLNAAPTKS